MEKDHIGPECKADKTGCIMTRACTGVSGTLDQSYAANSVTIITISLDD